MLNVALLGATGRMGKTLVRLISEADGCRISGALTTATSPHLGIDAGAMAGMAAIGAAVTSDAGEALNGADVAIDFTLAQAVAGNLAACVKANCPVVIGVTGLPPEAQKATDTAAAAIPVLVAANMSVGVNLVLELARIAARALGEDYDAEIVEIHHREKKDAPSGTALEIGEAVAGARGVSLQDRLVCHGQAEPGPRVKGSIGIASVRAGDIVGEHRLLLAAGGESVEIGHRATDRATFAEGAVRAARWLASRSPGRYSMADVLELDGN